MKTLLTLFILIACITANAQIQLTQDGIRDANDTSNHFIVLDYQVPQSELYKATLSALNKLYNSPKHVIDAVENASIKVNANSNIISVNKLTALEKQKYSVDYVVLLDFKDSKIRIEIPSVLFKQESLSGYNFFLVANRKKIGKTNGIWDYDGNLKNEWLKEDVEKYFNNWVGWLDKEIKNYSTW
ncbi:hypothetical protein [Sphingobacterium cellulitidis]|uniref:hypothetical protein n=1 Tax=Sphingobacterium cellulitidis TaxID=1768011 RepID=UPI003C7C2565